MITKKDLEINNVSYTNKDFEQIYPEQLDLVKKITNKWDPETTNESDPGLVLLKLNAFIGDKNNYNIDKNTLENMITSCTQRNSMQDICERLGYNIGYYKSATCDLTFTYLGGETTLDGVLGINQEEGESSQNGSFTLKAFDTSFITEDNIVYTLLEDIEISTTQRTTLTSKKVMQGELKALNISSAISTDNSSSEATKIQVYNLDENNRVYFPDTMVAENGVFINKQYYETYQNDNVWRKVDNLNDQDLGSRVYKFGYDSKKGFPYIEFPSDISDLIGDGLEIWYLVTSGVNGYVPANSLTAINTLVVKNNNQTLDITSLSEDYYSCNNSAGVGSSEPETIDEAYNNFKKTVGTFDTLVSCRDYSNGIYRYENVDGSHLVSNVQALDIRTDPNRKTTILQRDQQGLSYYRNIIKSDFKGKYNELVLHGLQPYDGDITTLTKYNNTYNKINSSQCQNISDAIEEYKTISHELVNPGNDEIHHIENRYKLRVNISTNYKVNQVEESSILTNVKNALYDNFNARQVDFGEEIPYDSILEVIKNADSRIKNVVLDDPEITPYIIMGSDQNISHKYSPDSGSDINILVDNILGGRLELYIDTKEFALDYNMDLTTATRVDNLIALNAETSMTLGSTSTEIQPNGTIQIVEDSYVSTMAYPAYVYYNFNGKEISANVVHKLTEDEVLTIYYTDSSDQVQIIEYGEGTFLKSSFDIGNTADTTDENRISRWLQNKEVFDTKPEGNSTPLVAISTDDTIEILEKNAVELNSNLQYCFWYIKPHLNITATSEFDENNNNLLIKNEESSLIFTKDGTSNKYFHILEEGEYFIYPDVNMLNLYAVGSGTKLEIEIKGDNVYPFEKEDDNTLKLVKKESNEINLEELEEALVSESVGSFEKSFRWEKVDFSKNPLNIVESAITTFVEGEKVSSSSLSISSTWSSLTSNIESESGLYSYSDVTNPKIRIILNVNGNSTTPQKLYANQKITYFVHGDKLSTGLITAGGFIQLYPHVDSYSQIILRTPKYNEELKQDGYLYDYSLFTYKNQVASEGTSLSTLASLTDGLTPSAERQEYVISLGEIKTKLGETSTSIDVTLNSSLNDVYINVFNTRNSKTLLLKPSDDNKITLNFGSGDNSIVDLSETGVNWSNYKLYLTVPKKLKLATWLSELDQSVQGTILDVIKTNSDNTFDYLEPLSNSKLITSYTPIYSFFDYNNVYNPLTIAKIDFSKDKFNCNIVASSRK